MDSFKPSAKKVIYKIKTDVWLYPGNSGAWHFVTVPQKQSDKIKACFGKNAKGWGSIPVTASTGKTNWRTSIFPDKKANAYLLPIKASVRKKESIKNGDIIELELKIEV